MRTIFQIVLLLALTFGTAAMGSGQTSPSSTAKQSPKASTSKAAPAEQTENSNTIDGEKLGGQGSQEESDGYRQWADQELVRVRQQFEREALDRMRMGRPYTWVDRILGELIPLTIFLVITGALLWILSTVLDNRRWNKMVKIQTDMHTKLLDKFASSQDMVAYMESDAGRKFLESPSFDIQPRNFASFPYGRIMLSAQAGLVVASVGSGLLFLRGKIPSEADAPMLVLGTVALALGLGFVLSAGVSYVLSKRFGLLERPGTLALGSDPNLPRG